MSNLNDTMALNSSLNDESLREKINVCFSFDELRILGAFRYDKDINLKAKYSEHSDDDVILVHVQGELWDYKDEKGPEMVVLILSDNLLQDALQTWINTKSSICTLWNEYCGVGGSIEAIDYEILKEKTNLLTGWREVDEEVSELIYTDVRQIVIYELGEHADMEHG